MFQKHIRYISLLAVALLTLSLLAGCAPKTDTDEELPPLSPATDYVSLGTDPDSGYDIVAQNDRYTLMFFPYSCALRLKDNAGGVWDSNPSALELLNVPSTTVQDTYRSQVTLQYYDGRQKATTLESYKDAVAKEQVEYFSIENGVRVVYVMGQVNDLVFPTVLSTGTAAQLEQMLDAETYARVIRFYDLVALEDLTEALQADYVKIYPLLATEKLYIARKIHQNIQNEISGYLKDAGLDKQWMYDEYTKVGLSYEVAEDVLFRVVVDYTLTEQGLKATLPAGHIAYDTEKYKVTNVSVLPYFGSAGGEDAGWMFVPDGSGALIDLATVSEKTVELPIYDNDFITAAVEDTGEINYGRSVTLPVFGMQKNGKSFVARITEGAELATLQCQPGGVVYPRDSVYPLFSLRARQELVTLVAGATSRVVYGEEAYTGNVSVLFHPLTADNGYAAMAAWVSEQLLGDHVSALAAAPFYLETIGAVQREEHFLSYKIDRTRALTTFAQAKELVEALYDGGVSHIQLRYDNWQGDVYDQTVTDNNRPESVLGGAGDLKALMEAMQEGSDLYLSFDPMMRKQQSFHGLQSIMTVNGRMPSYYGMFANMIYLNPTAVSEVFARIGQTLRKQTQAQVALDGVGAFLYTDGNDSDYRDRTEMRELFTAQMAALPEDRMLMLNAGHAYALPYADSLLNVPASHSNRYVEKESVPFLQMVLHGRIAYAGEALNMADDYTTAFLRSVEYGESPYYIINYASPSALKNTEYSMMYSTNYADWMETMTADWASRKELLAAIHGQKMTAHAMLAEGVYRTTYENGVTTVVNYTDAAVTAEGQTVPARDFVWTKGGA